MKNMLGPDRRIPSLRKLALLCAALVLVITSLSAFMRLSKAGLGCEPWPQCYAQSLYEASQGGAATASAGLLAAARLVHRVAAVGALLVIIMMVMTTLSTAPMLWREGRIALGLLTLALFLAVLGRWTAEARLPAVVMGNLLGGFAMVALSFRLVQVTAWRSGSATSERWLTRWVLLGIVLLVAQVALGGLLSARHAGLSCPELTRCDIAAADWQALNPWHDSRFDAADPINRGGALVHLLHRVGSLVVGAVLLPLGFAAWRRGRRAGAALILLLAVQVLLGAMLVLGALPLAVALAHNMVGALLLAVLASLAGDGRHSRYAAAATNQEKVSGSPVGPSAR